LFSQSQTAWVTMRTLSTVMSSARNADPSFRAELDTGPLNIPARRQFGDHGRDNGIRADDRTGLNRRTPPGPRNYPEDTPAHDGPGFDGRSAPENGVLDNRPFLDAAARPDRNHASNMSIPRDFGMVVDKDTPPQFGGRVNGCRLADPDPLAHFVAVDMALDPAFQNMVMPCW